VIFAFLGVIWAVAFALWFRDNPKDHPKVNAAELELLAEAQKNLGEGHAKIPWGRLFATRSVLLLWVYYFCISYVWYFYITWLPKFMEAPDGLGMDMKATSTSILNGLPLFFGGIGCFVGGLVAKKLASGHGRISVARRSVGVLGLLASGVMIVVAVQVKSPVLAMFSLGVSGFFNDLSMPGAWGACMDIGGKLAGSVSGSMNMIGNLGGALGGIAVPWLMKSMGLGWHGVLHVAAATYLVSALCWLFIDSDDRIHD
jgi:MFS family permease